MGGISGPRMGGELSMVFLYVLLIVWIGSHDGEIPIFLGHQWCSCCHVIAGFSIVIACVELYIHVGNDHERDGLNVVISI